MAIQAGLVGLPNVGKSTLFNALTKSSVPAENYPFCTIDPHVAITPVNDHRLDNLIKIFNSKKRVSATVQFSDIAGLVKGAATGEGLGNQFLGHIIDVDLILHVIRCFENDDITHVSQKIDPLEDFEIVCAELMLKDLESIEKREVKVLNILKTSKNKNLSSQQINELEKEKKLIEEVKIAIQEGNLDKIYAIVKKYKKENIKTISLLSAKNYLIIANFSEEDFQGKKYLNNINYKNLIKKFGQDKVIPVSAKIESEISQLKDEEKKEMLESLEITESGLDNIIKKTYESLGLITFFTAGPTEAHAWSIKKNTNVVQAAGTIHSDMERGFICAQIYNCKDIFELRNEPALKNAGKIRTEGKDYIVQNGDVLLIRFNV
ncbi:redox-regulated ATPase YchF [Candidatus Babeliales bacterium]|nr:redox-regulated ATPase YchF [Candidatus Babeliales bacterium]